MGVLTKIIQAKAAAAVVKKLNQKAREQPVGGMPRGQRYIPANAPAPGTLATRATEFYRQNPKLVAGVGLAVATMVLQQLTRKKLS